MLTVCLCDVLVCICMSEHIHACLCASPECSVRFVTVFVFWLLLTAAQATNEADRLSILEDIGKTIGVDRLNNLIREALVDSTKHEVEQLKASSQDEEDFRFHYFSALNKV